MSAALRSALGPIRARLVTVLDHPPDLEVELESADERTAQLRRLRAYKEHLDTKLARFSEAHNRLLNEFAQEEVVIALAATDADILGRCDEIIADVNTAIHEIEEQQADARQYDAMRNDAQVRREIQNGHAAAHAQTVKLPKIELPKFGGEVLRWKEFWDIFESTIHQNQSLGSVDKLHYLKGQLFGEARKAISGLASTNENYAVAVSLLKERFGKSQTIIDSHYLALTNTIPVNNHLGKLRTLVDSIELHLNSLAALGEDIEHRQFVSIIRSKLPSEVIIRLEEGQDGEPWTVGVLRERLRKYVSSRELAEIRLNGSEPVSTSTKRKDYAEQHNEHQWRRTTSSALVSSSKPPPKRPVQSCIFCKGEHWSDQCKTYPTMQARKKKIMGLCFGCFSPDHGIKDCTRVKPCFHCKKPSNHHSSLCPKQFGRRNEETVQLATEGCHEGSLSVSHSEGSLLSSNEAVLFQTATVNVESTHNSNPVSTKLLLDSGSQRTYISEKLAKQLQLKPVGKDKLTVFTFGSTSAREVETTVVKLKLKLLDGSHLTVSANVVPVITGNLHRSPVNFKKFDYLFKELRLADTVPTKLEEFTVDLLIGIDFYWDIVTSERIELGNGLYLIGSKIGWVLTGRFSTEKGSKAPTSTLFVGNSVSCESSLLSLVPIDEQVISKMDVKMFWDLETLGIRDHKEDPMNEQVLEKFNQTIKFEEGRYQVALPWNEKADMLTDNYQLALGRLKSMVKRGSQHPEQLIEYDKIIKTQLESGIIERVERTIPAVEKQHYIAHHAVITPSKTTTKIRIVFDGSAKSTSSNLSINDCLHRGPLLMKDLCSILLRFRLHKVALLADIEKAFHQVGLSEADRDFTRFIWLKNPSLGTTQDNIEIFRFTRVPFGLISSPFLLNGTVDYHLRSQQSNIADKILHDLYVDNLVSGVASEEEALQFYNEARKLFESASMNIREWLSNSDNLMEKIKTEDKASLASKVLGIPWDPKLDQLSLSIPFTLDFQKGLTKRIVLKFIASFFDPLGLFSPVMIRLKMFLQGLWESKLDWDHQLSPELIESFSSILQENYHCPIISIPRWVGTTSSAAIFELHAFCDASQKAYGCCIYLRIVGREVISHLVFAKSRLAPIRDNLSIPRLELLAVSMGKRCLNFVSESIGFDISRKFIWSDSQCVLHWLNSTKPLTTFVRNRINELKSTECIRFLYVPTGDNPADIASRGVSSVNLASSELWWKGPQWFSNSNESKWPQQPIGLPLDKNVRLLFDQEVIRGGAVCVAPEDPSSNIGIGSLIDHTKYSSLSKLLRVTALCLRFIDRLRKKQITQIHHVTSNELIKAKDMWIKWIQNKHYSDVIFALRDGRKHPLIEQFGLWIDDQGLLRCGGRLKNSNFPELAVHPKLVPKKDWFTDLLVKDTHWKLMHAGATQTLAQLRMEYWIPAGRAKVFSVIRSCKPCIKFDGGPYKAPNFPALPSSRVTPSVPFSHVGLDYFGPLYVKSPSGSKKVWIALFTCMSTRAIHLEVVEDMSASQFLLALKRFISRRGTPDYILSQSDNAAQFKLAKSIIAQLWRNVRTNEEVWSYISSRNINWAFIVERAPWKGGFYERLIRLIKQGLRKSIQHICLTLIQLQTIMTEIEAVVNSRPLTYVGADIRDGTVLTPSHFLSLNRNTGAPEYSHNTLQGLETMGNRNTLLDAWHKGQRHLKTFWLIWQKQYLLSLRERDSQIRLRCPRILFTSAPKVGDIVHIKQDLPRGTWPLARIVELCPSADGKLRSAKVQLPSGSILTRAVVHLYPLECPEEETEGDGEDSDETASVEL